MSRRSVGIVADHVGIGNYHVGIDPQPVGTIAGHVGIDLQPVGTVTECVGIDPQPVGTVADHVGIDPQRVGTVADHVGIDLQPVGTIADHLENTFSSSGWMTIKKIDQIIKITLNTLKYFHHEEHEDGGKKINSFRSPSCPSVVNILFSSFNVPRRAGVGDYLENALSRLSLALPR